MSIVYKNRIEMNNTKGKYNVYLPRTRLSFESIRALRAYIHTIINPEITNVVLEYEDGYIHRFLLDMLQRHPDIYPKLKDIRESDIKFLISNNKSSDKDDRYKVFYYIHAWKVFSLFVKCVAGRTNTHPENVIKAFSNSVTYIIEAFVIQHGSICECGLNAKHIEHEYPIESMVYDFLSEQKLDIDNIEITNRSKEPYISDEDIEKTFRHFFKKKSHMKYYCDKCDELWRIGLTDKIEERIEVNREILEDIAYEEQEWSDDSDDEDMDPRDELEKRLDCIVR